MCRCPRASYWPNLPRRHHPLHHRATRRIPVLRSTVVQTFDRADVIVPNSDLITKQVTNWTLTNRQARVHVPVGVAYGSDVPLVMHTLATCAQDHPAVMDLPEPQVLFRRFGDSTLDFELRV